MYKAFAVDDEPSVIEGIKIMIPWSELDFELCGTASDAADALASIQEQRPHLLISDIRMPHLSGLELVNEARKLDFDLEFILLTGYSDFSYIQQAMRNQVFDYLLKPLDRDEMISVLHKVKVKLDNTFLTEYGFSQEEIDAFKTRRSLLSRDGSAANEAGADEKTQWRNFEKDFDEELTKTLKLMDLSGAVKLIDELFDFFAHNKVCLQEVRIIINSCIYHILRIAFERNIRLNSALVFEKGEALDIGDMKKHLTNITSRIIGLMLEDRRKNSRSYLYEVKEYIEEHFNKELSVSRLAKMKYLEAGYLGEAFIKQFGCSINEYQHRLRIKKAIDLMKTTNMKLNDISSIVGYNNYNNFFSHFEKITHKKPTQYDTKTT
ncbi:MAG: response regulator [Clostridiaceae bacterium]|jgi:two-component system response regulator YesN|nr:response regulator [Clostridiaceae bacterium]